MPARSSEDTYSEKETTERREAALKRMLSTPHKPHTPLGDKGAAKKQKEKGKHGKAR
jgi:hypothetical protein